MKKTIARTGYCLLLASFMAAMAGCGGGGGGGAGLVSVKEVDVAVSAEQASVDAVRIYAVPAAARIGGRAANAASDKTMVALPAKANPPAGAQPVSGASVNFMDGKGNVVALKTDDNGNFNPNDLGTAGKSSNPTLGKAIVKEAQTNIAAQPSATVMPPATGTFKDCKPAEANLTIAPTKNGKVEIAALGITPETKTALKGESVTLTALAIDASGMVTRPSETVTWKLNDTATDPCEHPANSTDVCIYKTTTAGTFTIKAMTPVPDSTRVVGAAATVRVLDSAAMATISGTIYQSESQVAGWPNSIINFDIQGGSDGELPYHVTIKADSKGAFTAQLPANMKFTRVFAGTPSEKDDDKREVFQVSPDSYTTGAAGASVSNLRFIVSTNKYAPPPRPINIKKYIMNAYWDLRQAVEPSVFDPTSGIRDSLRNPASSGALNSIFFKGWTWTKAVDGPLTTWTFIESSTAPGYIPHQKGIITSTTPNSSSPTYQFAQYYNRSGNVNNGDRKIDRTGEWTENIAGTSLLNYSGNIKGFIKYYNAEKQEAPNNVVDFFWAINRAAVTYTTTVRNEDGTKELGKLSVMRSPPDPRCKTPTCKLCIYTSLYIRHFSYTAKGEKVEDLYGLAGTLYFSMNSHFEITNKTPGHPENGVKVVFDIPAPPNGPSETPPDLATGELWGMENGASVRMATFVIDSKYHCKIKKYPDSPKSIDDEVDL